MVEFSPFSDEELAVLFRGLERTPLALAVSGGADSMALMHMVARWARRSEVRAAWLQRSQAAAALSDHAAPQGIDWTGLAKPLWLRDVGNADEFDRAGGLPHVVVLTVDHGLRAASADEARLVCSEAEKLGLSCAVLKWEGGKPATGVQDAARNARRDLMCDVLRAERGLLSDIARARETTGGFIPHRRLAMAHHQGDQAETFLMRLARGSGLEGLGGIKPSSWIERAPTAERPASFQVAVERPLLDVPKERFISYPAAGRDSDSTELLGWAGWDHAEQALALAYAATPEEDE